MLSLSTTPRALFVLVALVLAQFVHYLLLSVMGKFSSGRRNFSKADLWRHANRPLRLLLTLIALALSVTMFNVDVPSSIAAVVHHTFEVVCLVAVTWFVVKGIELLHLFFIKRLPEEMQDNVAARRIRTQVNFFRQLAIGLALFLGSTAVLVTFPAIRSLGNGLFASAGVAGLVLGIAARPTLGNLIAGIQIAVTEAIRIDDAVVIDGDFGRVVEINTTNVVIRLWDLRHLIVPVSHFVEKPFQNWTRYSSELIGAVHLQLDHMARVEQLREYYGTILEGSRLWDRKIREVQVTDAKDTVIEVRFLMSAATPADTFSLRCHVRETMITYLQDNYPQALPRSRSEIAVTGALGHQEPVLKTSSTSVQRCVER